MTNEQIDAIVHREVMGATWDETKCRVCGWELKEDAKEGCIAGNCSQRPVLEQRADKPPAYSTDIAAAWLVLEHLRKEGWGFDIEQSFVRGPHSDQGTTDDVQVWLRHRKPPHHAFGDAPSVAMAICLAALKVRNPNNLEATSTGDPA